MAEQLPKDPVSLDDLKRVLGKLPDRPSDLNMYQDLPIELRLNYAYHLVIAWRTAFKWLWSNATSIEDEPRGSEECAEGMRLIEEKLQS